MRRLLFALTLSLAGAAAHAADAPAEPVPPQPDPEEQLDEGLKRFGYLAGLTRGCVTDEQRPALEKEALDLHAGIARLLGTDRAFLFGAAFGNGTGVTLELKECEEVIAAYEQRVVDFRARQGGKP